MVINIDELEAIRQKHASQKIVLSSGTFDLLHAGHIAYLKGVKSMAI